MTDSGFWPQYLGCPWISRRCGRSTRAWPALNERSRRLWAAREAKALGHGGIALVERATGISRSTIQRGLREIEAGEPLTRSEPAGRAGGANPPRRGTRRCSRIWMRSWSPRPQVIRSRRSAGRSTAWGTFPRRFRRWAMRSAIRWRPSCCMSWATAYRRIKKLQQFLNRTGLAITVCHFPARDEQVEQDRAPPLLAYRDQLAWKATGQPSST